MVLIPVPYPRCHTDQVIDMSLNGNEIRDTAQVLKISSPTVINEFKKASPLISFSQPLLNTLNPGDVDVIIRHVDEAEVGEL